MDCLAFFIGALLLLYKCEGITVDSTVKLANNMILKCVCPKNGTISLISWSKKKGNEKDNVAVFELPHNLHIGSKYKNRVHIVKQNPNNKTLIFTNATEADIGYYHCSFTLFPHGIWEKIIHVVPSGDFEPHVLPAFRVVTMGRGANLSCLGDPEVAVNQVIWEKVQADCVDLVVQCGESGTPICGAEYEERVKIDCANRAKSTMTLGNVIASDSGMYRCRFIGANGENTTGWTKLINNGTGGPLDYGQTVFFIAGGAVVTIVLLIIILAIIVTVHHHRKRKRKRVMMAKLFHVAQKQDSNRYGRPGFQGRRRASEEENMDTFATVQEQVYVNYRACSPKANIGV